MRAAVMFLLGLAASSGWSAFADDRALVELIEEATAASPEVAQARAQVEVERARVPQAGALPDPTLTLGIQNDGFKRIEVGTMETSFFNVMLTQPLFWPGKRGVREQVATFEVKRAEARLSRAMLDVEGRVRRAWVGLLLVRGQIELLAEEGLEHIPLAIVMNRAESAGLFRSGQSAVTIKDAAKAMGRDIPYTIPNDYKSILEAVNHGLPLAEVKGGKATARQITDVMKRILAQVDAAQPQPAANRP